MTSPKRVVVVGNGIAGLTAADTLRAEGFDGELTIVGDEPAYSRPALSKAMLRAGDDRSSHELPPPTHGADELLGARATRLDVGRRTVHLADGHVLPYDGLVLATGARARRLSDLPGEHTLRGIDDALALRTLILARPSVLVIGGGPLGMEIASGCLAAGCRVTMASRGMPLRDQLGEHLAQVFVTAARARGLALVETPVARLEERVGVTSAVLTDESVLAADLVISAAGDLPNTEWLAGSGLVDSGPLTVDERGRIAPDVVAVGDLAAFPTGSEVRRTPLWSSAIEQARTAARALVLGDEAPVHSVQSYFWTEAFGLGLKVVGDVPTEGTPLYLDGRPGQEHDGALLRWDGAQAAAALNYRIPIPRLRRLTQLVTT